MQLIENHLLFKPLSLQVCTFFFALRKRAGRGALRGKTLSRWWRKRIIFIFLRQWLLNLYWFCHPWHIFVGMSRVKEHLVLFHLMLKWQNGIYCSWVTVLLRYNSQIIQLTHLKYTNQWFSIFTEVCNCYHILSPPPPSKCLLVVPGITFQMNYLHLNPCLKICFCRNSS